jgi:hypothetical protein
VADLNKFAQRIRRVGDRIATNADKMTRKAALAIDATVVLATPVDTGRARGNWQVELDNAKEGTVEPQDRSGQAAINQGKGVIAQYNGDTSKEIHITNNLPYIGKLNEGHSAQAPAAFVEKAVMVGVEAVRGSKLL